ncbi:VOC family protein [Catellatospora sp. KI3]|uniref:VOC family protein n=1 Tax=Catellatospora sp. KI3 TaxID=3041620 RepID=UPI002482F142|nr:VOC family protein [Catellatospora sp. KI3]MDI1465686.1 VOC family protein [Catellatospora sp. KI3]
MSVPTPPAIRWLHAFLDYPADRFDAGTAFWLAVTGTRLSARRGAHGEFATLLGDGDAHLKAQVVGPPGGMHLDPATDDPQALVWTALRLGGSIADTGQGFTVLRSPGGLLLCAVPYQGDSARTPVVTGPAGAVSRVDQVCLDIAPSRRPRSGPG